jgi:hypothetical protein
VHGVVGGALSMAQGGTFVDGFIANGVGAAAGIVTGDSPLGSVSGGEGVFFRTAIAAAAGGTASALTGGKFANGAVTAAMAHLFNAEGVLARGLEGTQSGINEVGRANSEAIGDPMMDLAAVVYAVLSPSAGATECWQAECGVGGWISAAAMSLPGIRPVGILTKSGTVVTKYLTHGVDRAIGDTYKRAGTRPAAILDALKSPLSVKSGIDEVGRPFEVYRGKDARVVVNPQEGSIVSVNPLSRRGVR